MSRYEFDDFPGTSSVVGAVTLLVSGWFFLAVAAMVTLPTDGQVARGAAVTVRPLGVISSPQPAPQPATIAIAPEARLTIVVAARRA